MQRWAYVTQICVFGIYKHIYLDNFQVAAQVLIQRTDSTPIRKYTCFK